MPGTEDLVTSDISAGTPSVVTPAGTTGVPVPGTTGAADVVVAPGTAGVDAAGTPAGVVTATLLLTTYGRTFINCFYFTAFITFSACEHVQFLYFHRFRRVSWCQFHPNALHLRNILLQTDLSLEHKQFSFLTLFKSFLRHRYSDSTD